MINTQYLDAFIGICITLSLSSNFSKICRGSYKIKFAHAHFTEALKTNFSICGTLGDSWKPEMTILFQDTDITTALRHLSVFAEPAKFYDEIS